MGNDQVEGIISPAAAVLPPNHAAHFNSLWPDVTPCPSCPRRVQRQDGAEAAQSNGSPAVTVRKMKCECHCRTCFSLLSPPVSPALPPSQPAGVQYESPQQQLQTFSTCQSPSPRYGHTLSLYRAPGQFILFGGTTYLKYFDDLWLLDITRQSFVRQDDAIGVPSPRFGHTSHIVPSGHCIFFGGSTNVDWFDDLYTTNIPTGSDNTGPVVFKKWNRHQPSDPWPCARRSHTFVHYKGTRSVLYGGYCRVSLHDVWFLDMPEDAIDCQEAPRGPQWHELQTCGVDRDCPCSKCPDSRYCHSSVVAEDAMLVFGGYCAGGVTAPVLWRLDLVTGVWSAVVTTGQVPRGRFGQTSSVIGNRMVVFGGMSNFPHGEALSDCFIFGIDTNEWREVVSPLRPHHDADAQCNKNKSSSSPDHEENDAVQQLFGRRSHAAAVDPATHSVVIFGGWNSQNVTDDYCFKLVVAPPTLRELVRNFIGVKLGDLS